MIEITSEQINRVHLLLQGIPNAVSKVLYNVINRGLSAVRTQANKEAAAVYRIKQDDLKKNQKINVRNATSGNLEGQVSFAGAVIPLIKFNVSPSEPKRKTVSVSVLKKESAKRLKDAYVANLGRYGTGVFERLTSKRESSQQLFGPSFAHMIENQEVMTRIEKRGQEIVDKRVEHEITRILNGYGGK